MMTTGSMPQALNGGTKTDKPLSALAKHIHKGGLHESLGVPLNKTIPKAKIETATHSDNPKVRRQADLAETFAHHNPNHKMAHKGTCCD